MNRRYNYFLKRWLYIQLLIVFSASAAYTQVAPEKGVLRIKVTETYASKLIQRATGRKSANVIDVKATGLAKLDLVNTQYKATSMKRVFPHAGKFEAKHRKHGLHLWYEVQIDSTAPITLARSAYQDIADIQIVEPVHTKTILDYDKSKFKVLSSAEAAPGISPFQSATNDPLFDKQWHYYNHGQTNGVTGADIDLLKAWSVEAGRKEVIVAIIDGGIQADHPDLKDNMWVNEDEIPGNGMDDDNNGFVDDIHGYSFVDSRPSIKPHPHGTHVAGTVAATNNNGIGVSGVAGGTGKGDGVRLMSCSVYKFLTPYVEISGGYENAFVYAADNGAVISQNSWGYKAFDYYDQVVLDAIDYFIAEAGQDENGIQTGPMKGGVIFSTGNNGVNGNMYPAYYEPTLSVASLTHRNFKAYNSNYGDWVDIAAPGGEMGNGPDEEGILSTFVGGGYAFMAGTSMAAPHVSGTAALVVSHFGGAGFTPEMLRQRLLSTAENVDFENPGYTGMLGSGRVEAFHALHGENDLAGPEVITDLQVKSTTVTSLTLEWTAPADGGARSASAYEMRYSTSPVTPANFNNANYVPRQPRTNPAGTTETYTITGLQKDRKYYVAMLSYDMFRNASPLSHVAEAITRQPEKRPEITINPFPLGVEMLPVDTIVKTVYVTNSGTSDLSYSILRKYQFGWLEDAFRILTFSKRSGIVPPGESDTLLLTFKTNGISENIYEEFTMVTNDPVYDTLYWPIQFTLLETTGKPVFNNEQLDFGKTHVGTPSERTVALKSTGSKGIKLLRYTIDNPDFSVYINDFYVQGYYMSFTLKNFDTLPFKVFYHPSTPGKTSGVLTIYTDDPEYRVLTLPLSGEGLPVPEAHVNTDTLSASLKTNESTKRNFTLSNSGESEMTFDILSKGLFVEPKKVLVVSPDGSRIAMPFLLTPYPEFSVNVHDDLSKISLADLIQYDVVMVFNNNTWNSAHVKPETIGDLLADYIDAGGKVIVNAYAYQDDEEGKIGLAGRFITEKYGPFIGDVTDPVPPRTLGEITVPDHPLFEGVHNLASTNPLQKVKLSPGATGLAKWSGGEWMLAVKADVVSMNFMLFGGSSSEESITGDFRQLYRNALHWLTGSSHFTASPAKGSLAPGESVVIEVEINSNTLATGLHRSAFSIVTNDPYHGQLIVPVSLQVEGPAFSISPGSVSLAAGIDQQAAQDVKLRNEGTQSWPYVIRTENFQSHPRIVGDAADSQYFSTGFGSFNPGSLTENENWYNGENWYIDTVAAFSGKQHLRYTSNGMMNPVRLISPTIESGDGKSFCSANIMIDGQGTDFSVSPLSLPSWFAVTTITFAGDGNIRVEIYNKEFEFFDVKQIREPIPSGYFTVSFDLDKTTSVFHIYINQKLVFTGTSPMETINAIAFESNNRKAGQNFYVDDILVRQGAAETVTEFLQASPASGILQPGEEVNVVLEADARGLRAGEYGAHLVADIGEGTEHRAVPVLFTVTDDDLTPSAMSVSHDAIAVNLDYNTVESRFFEISNPGGNSFDFTVAIPEEATSWLSVEPASGSVSPNSVTVVKVRYTSARVSPGFYASTISITGTAANVPGKQIETSLDVRQPAMAFAGPSIIEVEMMGGKSVVYPLVIINGGFSLLDLKLENTNRNWLRVGAQTKKASPLGGRMDIPVTLNTVDVIGGVYRDTLRIQTNDPENHLLRVPVQLTVIDPPAMNVLTDSLKFTIQPGTQTTRTIAVRNSGSAGLDYVVSDRMIFTGSAFHGGPDNFGYTFTDTREPGGPAFVWNDISETGTPVSLGDYDSVTVSLPFVFPFYGVEQSEVKICSDGFLTFNSMGLPMRYPEDRFLFHAAAPNNIIAAHWDDLDPRKGGTIHYKKEDDKFIVQYTNISFNNWAPSTDPWFQNTFQMVLHADGSIAFHYLNIMTQMNQLVGIGNSDASDGLLVKYNWEYPSADSTSILITPTSSWISVPVQSNTIPAGEEDTIDIQFDAGDLDEGVYSATLYITGNDYKNPVKRIPVTMDVRSNLVTGTEREEGKAILILYPVPARDVLNIKLTRKIVRPVSLVIRNTQGQTALAREVNPDEMVDYQLHLNQLHLSPGVYFLQLISPEGWTTTKSFVKQ